MESVCAGLGKLLNAGLPLALALGCIESGIRSKIGQMAVHEALQAIERGSPLSEVWRDLGTPLFVTLLRVSERCGRTADMLLKWSEHVRRRRERNQEILKLCGYPSFVLCFNVGLLMFVIKFLLPRFAALSTQLNAQTAPSVGFIIQCLSAVPVMMVIIPGGVGFLVLMGHVAHNQSWISLDLRVLRQLPGMKMKQLNRTATLCLLLTTLLESGISLVESLEIISSQVNTFWLQQTATKMHEELLQGKGLGNGFSRRLGPNLGAHGRLGGNYRRAR